MHLHVETLPGKPLRAFGVSNKKKRKLPWFESKPSSRVVNNLKETVFEVTVCRKEYYLFPFTILLISCILKQGYQWVQNS